MPGSAGVVVAIDAFGVLKIQMNFGIDFGTTNTAISRIVDSEPVTLRFGAAQQQYDYVPSLLALKPGPIPKEYHGLTAKARIGEPGLDVYQNFKMLLGESSEMVAPHWGPRDLTPEEVARKFIAGLIRQIEEEHCIRPSRVVVTVPEVWGLQNLLIKREHLIQCFKEHGIARVEVRSEPVAAAGYYLHCFKRKKGQTFQGHLLVCDCGGGTLDFCLVRVETVEHDRPRITILERSGNGMINGRIGSAGVAFDQAMVEKLFPVLKAQEPQKFFRRVREFEEAKIINTDEISRHLELYRQQPDLVEGESLFYLDETQVEAQHLVEVFDAIIRPGIQTAMTELLQKIDLHSVGLNAPAEFRVLMVGGFSSFYLVQETIKDAFGSVLSTDQRFEDIFSLTDRAFAIAKGAALIANDLAEIVETCPADVGIMGFGCHDDGTLKRLAVPILKKSEKIQHYHQPVWAENLFQILNENMQVPIYLESVPGQPITLDVAGETMQSILPSGIGVNDKVELGFSVDENMVY